MGVTLRASLHHTVSCTHFSHIFYTIGRDSKWWSKSNTHWPKKSQSSLLALIELCFTPSSSCVLVVVVRPLLLSRCIAFLCVVFLLPLHDLSLHPPLMCYHLIALSCSVIVLPSLALSSNVPLLLHHHVILSMDNFCARYHVPSPKSQ